MNDDRELLASAYLDGAVTSEERARAEADPEVMAEVERLRSVRRALAADRLEQPSRARRDAAINAALAEFDTQHRAASRPVPAPSARRRRWTSAWLAPAAAAAVALVVVGGIVATRDGGGDGDDAGGAADTTAQSAVGGEGELAPATDEAADTTATARVAEDRQDAGVAGGATATTELASPLYSVAPEMTAGATEVPALPDDLGRIGRERMRSFDPGAENAPSCRRGRFLGRVHAVVDGVETTVELYLRRGAGVLVAVDPDTCAVVARAPAPDS